MSGEIVVLVTVASESEAKRIAWKIVQDKLVACVNIVPTIQSVFEWEGTVAEEQESLLIIKTKADVFDLLESVIKRLHSYRVPEIIALPIQVGSSDYLAWVAKMVNPKLTEEV
ncbi:MAG: divalent-cation tolerance protein CutA [Nitrospirales bacterium]|nr:MAG: divalent-cation tolerance protein CutA [Nitrospirales bacterium]